MLVDLFKPSTSPEHGLRAGELQEQGLTLFCIAKELGITKRTAHLAARYGQQLREAGLVDPFVELTEPPAAASRWRVRSRSSPDEQECKSA